MKRGLKKKGSSLVAVLVICSIILVVASTMIGVATSNVRMRMNESKKLQNLYKADSGLEIVNSIILKDSEAAIVYAQEKTQSYTETNRYIANADDEEVYNNLNKEFKAQFIKALISGVTVTNDNNYTTEQDLMTQYNNITPDTSTDETITITQNAANPISRLLVSLKNYRYITTLEDVDSCYKNAFGTGERPTIRLLSIKYNDIEKTIK